MIKKIYKAAFLLFLFSIGFFLVRCTPETDKQIDEVNTSEIKLTLKFERFEQDLFKANNASEIAALEKKYPDFYPVYIYQLMGDITQPNQSTIEAAANLMRNFTTIPDFGLVLKHRSDSVFEDIEPFKVELTEAMKRYKYYFALDTIPKFITFLSPFRINFPVIEGRNQIGIGLDMYLGSNFMPYHSPQIADQFPGYRVKKMRKEYLLRDLLTAMAETKLIKVMAETKPLDNNSRLIDEMIFEGKMLYLVDALIPETPDSIKLGYTQQQMKWANENESSIWAALVDSKILYSTEPTKIRDFINDGPFTTAPGFGAGTSPRIGAYTGWQIVKKYMNKNPTITLQQLLAETDSDDILNKSKYKP